MNTSTVCDSKVASFTVLHHNCQMVGFSNATFRTFWLRKRIGLPLERSERTAVRYQNLSFQYSPGYSCPLRSKQSTWLQNDASRQARAHTVFNPMNQITHSPD
ncbi:hypothetical protein N7G274_005868 [Stereocaulon virgatum]|uniref:Uncharacterized protein n=1 Tax=Stereocaulon virgatum TaxID=373712 RepID=A0ABR4A7W2_9LECA